MLLLIANTVNAQIKVKVNDNLIAENAVIKADEIKKFEIGFDKPKLLKDYGYGGEATILISQLLESGEYLNLFRLTRSGTNAIEAFLEDVNTFYILYEEGQPSKDFGLNRNFARCLKQEIQMETVILKIELFFRDKVGYETFGDPINLLKPITLKFDNKINLENYNKEVAARKAQEQKEQKVSEEKEKKDKKVTPGKVLRGILGR